MAISPLILLVLLSLSKAAPAEDSMIPGGNYINNLVERGVDVVTQWVSTYTEAPYTVTQTHSGGVQERLYPAMSWMCNKRTENTESDIQRSSLFWPLFSYIQGGNADLTMIPMTIPVTTLVTHTNGQVTLEMCFFMGADTPPASTNPAVYLKQEGERRIVTRTVGGYMDTEAWKVEAEELRDALHQQGINFVEDRWYQVGYDAPHKFWNRRNEIWYMMA